MEHLCRISFSTFAEHLLPLFLQNMSQYFCRLLTSIYAEHISVFTVLCRKFTVLLQKTSQHVFKAPFIVSEHAPVVLESTSQYFFEIISQYFCITNCRTFKNSVQQFFIAHISMFAEYSFVFLQKTSKAFITVKYIVSFQSRIFQF